MQKARAEKAARDEALAVIKRWNGELASGTGAPCRDAVAGRVLSRLPNQRKIDVIDHSDGRPRMELAFMPLGPVAVGTLVSTPLEFIRRNHHLKDCSDNFRLDIIAAGQIQFSHAGEERVYGTGGAHLVDQGRPFRAFRPCDGGVRYITVQAAALNPSLRKGTVSAV